MDPSHNSVIYPRSRRKSEICRIKVEPSSPEHSEPQSAPPVTHQSRTSNKFFASLFQNGIIRRRSQPTVSASGGESRSLLVRRQSSNKSTSSENSLGVLVVDSGPSSARAFPSPAETYGYHQRPFRPQNKEISFGLKLVSRSQPSLLRHRVPERLDSIGEEVNGGPNFDPIESPPFSDRAAVRTLPREPHRAMLATALPNGDISVAENNNVLKDMVHSDGTISPVVTSRKLTFDEEDIVFDESGRILAGSLKALVKKLIPRRDYCPDRSYIFAFLLNARIFISPVDLMQQIIQHCIFEQNSAADNFRKEALARFFHGIVRLCSEWTETFPYDFCSEKMMERVEELLYLCSSTDPNFQRHTNLLQQNLLNKLSKLERYEKALCNIRNEVTHQISPFSSESFSDLCSMSDDGSVVAHQLTHIELERLSMIGPEEFVQTFAKEYLNGDNGILPSIKVTRNIQHYVDWFNRLTFLVATDICKQMKKKYRARCIEFFIHVAKECFNLGNFNSLMAIVAGLNMTPVARLKKTWAKVETSKLDILQHQLDPSGNFTSYRSTLKAALWRAEGAKDSREKIVVPFFSLFVKDLLIVHQKCARRLPNGHINFMMFLTFARQMRDFLKWKRVECPYERQSNLLQYILTSPTFTEKALQLASFECEPPEISSEKEQHKSLKYVHTRQKLTRHPLSFTNGVE